MSTKEQSSQPVRSFSNEALNVQETLLGYGSPLYEPYLNNYAFQPLMQIPSQSYHFNDDKEYIC